MKAISFFFRQFPSWAWDGRYFILYLLTATLLCVLIFFSPSSDLIRYVGLVFQLLGISLLLLELCATRDEHGFPSWRTSLANWWSRRPRMRPKVIAGGANLSVGISMVSGRGKGRWPTNPNADVSERIGNLEKNFELLDAALDQAFREFDGFRQDQKQALDQVRQDLVTATARLEERLRVVATGRLSISALSAAWIVIGVVLETVPSEIARVLSWLSGA